MYFQRFLIQAASICPAFGRQQVAIAVHTTQLAVTVQNLSTQTYQRSTPEIPMSDANQEQLAQRSRTQRRLDAYL